MRLLVALVLAVALGGCRCGGGVVQVSDGLRVPQSLDLGRAPVGSSARAALRLTNEGPAVVHVALDTGAPFSAQTPVEVPGGGVADVPVLFTPSALGRVDGTLRLTFGTRTVLVALTAEGVDPCAPAVCRTSTFDAASRQCVEAAAPDGTACADGCVTDGRCEQGLCTGSFAGCDDGDACTIDACGGDGGCVHVPRSCAVSDPCLVATCDADGGCGSAPVEDGTPCGDSDCATAHVCINGACAVRTRPGAAADCHYVEVVSSGSHACALARSGTVRCWGQEYQWNGGARLASPPGAVLQLSGLHGLAAIPSILSTCGLDPAGTAVCGGGIFPDGGGTWPFSGPAEKLTGRGCAKVGDTVDCVFFGVRADAGVADVFDDCWSDGDGGVTCPASGYSFPAQPVDLVDTDPWPVALLPGGTVVRGWLDGGWSVLIDAGVQALGSGVDTWCAAWTDGGVTCFPSLDPPVQLASPPFVSLTHGAWYGLLCGLTDGGEVWCAGPNDNGQLGDRSVQPEGLVVAGFSAPLSRVSLGRDALEGCTLGWGGGELQSFGAFDVLLDAGFADGGMPYLLGTLSDVEQLVAAPSGTRAASTRLCARHTDGTLECWLGQGGQTARVVPTLPGPATGLALLGSSVPFWVALVGQQIVSAQVSPVWPPEALQVESPGCVLFTDGGAACATNPPFGPLNYLYATLPSAAQSLSVTGNYTFAGGGAPTEGACAVLAADGSVWCWGSDGVAAEVPGAPHYPRQVVGSGHFGCALFGVNGVRCWGSNFAGGLARDVPEFSAAALDVAVPEAITSLQTSGLHTCALAASGRLYCWGYNADGELGVPALRHSSAFLQVTR